MMLKLYVCLSILLYFVAENTNSLQLCDRAKPEDVVNKVYLKLYKGNSSSPTYTTTPLTNPEALIPEIKTDQNSVVYAHGFGEDGSVENVLVVINAYLDVGNVNIIVIDWGDIARDKNYFRVSGQVPAVGKAAAKALMKLKDAIDFDRLHVVGHSLGSQVVGQLGRSMNGTLNRITALDPAFPLFYPSSCHIRSTDAKIVSALHTNGGVYGVPFNTGTVDFYANTGLGFQPGCPVWDAILCSHQRSTKYFAESVKNPKAFPAHRCITDALKGQETEEVYYGPSTPASLHGEYCFSTNSEPPYGKET